MFGKFAQPRLLGLLVGIVSMTLFAVACSGDAATPTSPPPTSTTAPKATTAAPAATTAAPAAPATEAPKATRPPVSNEPEATPVPKQVIKMYDATWSSIIHNTNIPGYIIEHGYEYPVDYVVGTTGTIKVGLPTGEFDVVMEVWRQNIEDWWVEHTTSGAVVDLTGGWENVANGSPGQILENSAQGFYIPDYIAEQNPGLKSVTDLPDYVHLFTDAEDPSKGVVFNCIIGWQCQKINRAKWFAYGLYDTYNVAEPGSAGALDAAIAGAVTAGEPVLSYYWEPTTIVVEQKLVRLEEPEWTQECQDAMNLGVESTPYESTMGCAYPIADVHSAVYSGLAARAPEVTTFLANTFIGALPLGALDTWQAENDAEFRDAAVHYLKENKDVWTTWITDDNAAEIIARVDDALAAE
jgi:glycine betaine/proline transport system substrate-binding protein